MPAFDPVTVALGGTNLVEASAGTGKTFTIATLFVRLVLERELDVDRILVVTFTEAAAAELRGRIRERLLQAANRPRVKKTINRVFACRILTATAGR